MKGNLEQVVIQAHGILQPHTTYRRCMDQHYAQKTVNKIKPLKPLYDFYN